MKINILQRGGYKDNHAALTSATEYFCKMLMSTRMCNTLNIRLEVRATKLPSKALGSCYSEPIGSKTNTDFTVMIKRGSPLMEQLETLAHEIVHVHQKRTNLLQYRLWKSDNKYHARWNGQEMGTYDSIPYAKRPWEIEAAILESIMLKAFICHDKNRPDLEEKARSTFDKTLKALESDRKNDYRNILSKREPSIELSA